MKLKLFSGAPEAIEKQFAEWHKALSEKATVHIQEMHLTAAMAVLPVHQTSSVAIPGLLQGGVSVMNAQMIVVAVLYEAKVKDANR